MSTKTCPKCGCKELSLMHGSDHKICTGCGCEIDWPLEPGQKSLFRKNVVGKKESQDGASNPA